MRLHDLKPRPGAKRRRKRVGRGESSGLGKTSGRGHKGQLSRSGGGKQERFEGGQMPLVRRLPKRGFNNARHRTRYLVVNVRDLNRFDDGTRIDQEALKKAGLVKRRGEPVKILGNGELHRKLTVSVDAVSGSAREKIESLGGTCEMKGQPSAADAS